MPHAKQGGLSDCSPRAPNAGLLCPPSPKHQLLRAVAFSPSLQTPKCCQGKLRPHMAILISLLTTDWPFPTPFPCLFKVLHGSSQTIAMKFHTSSSHEEWERWKLCTSWRTTCLSRVGSHESHFGGASLSLSTDARERVDGWRRPKN